MKRQQSTAPTRSPAYRSLQAEIGRLQQAHDDLRRENLRLLALIDKLHQEYTAALARQRGNAILDTLLNGPAAPRD